MERLRNPNAGLGQYCLQLGRALAAQPVSQTTQFECYLPTYLNGVFGTSIGYLASRKWHKLTGVSTDAALWHCMHQDSAYFPKGKRTAIAMTIHDLNFLERADYSHWRKKIKMMRIQRRINQVKGLVYVSAFVKKVVHNHLNIPMGVLEKVIYNGVSVGEMSNVANGLERQPFLFSIGLHPKKNYAPALPLLKSNPDYQWVIAGSGSNSYRAELEKEAAAMGVSSQLVFKGAVSEAEKWQLYQHCQALIFPSLSEGFGLPVLEAMVCGKPVFLSDLGSLPEIGGVEAYYFKSFDPGHIRQVFAEGMKSFNSDPEKPKRLKAYAKTFKWENAAKDYLEFYEKLM